MCRGRAISSASRFVRTKIQGEPEANSRSVIVARVRDAQPLEIEDRLRNGGLTREAANVHVGSPRRRYNVPATRGNDH